MHFRKGKFMLENAKKGLRMNEPLGMSGWVTVPLGVVVFIASNIGTAIYASRKTAEAAQRVAAANHEALQLMSQKLDLFISSQTIHNNRTDADFGDMRRNVQAMQSNLDMLRGQIGTRSRPEAP